jgi:16S rRNA (cytidine1402-2'-O)-methyltransferase
MTSTLWLVATPIGNLGDLQPRAIEVLASVDLVCCEDTRRTGLLLHNAGVKAKRMAVCNEHTEHDLIDRVLRVLDEGGDVAVVSDAGTPGVSDPGERLVRAVVDTRHRVSAVPGPSAAIMALTISGLDTSRFVFEGFLPRKGKDRATLLAEIAGERRTTVLYEAPPRVTKTLADLADACGPDRRVVVTRELTKLHEEVVRGTLGSIDVGEPRGEYVLVIAGTPVDKTPVTDDDVRAMLADAIAGGLSKRDAAADVAAQTGRPKRAVYQLTLEGPTAAGT